MITVPTDTAAYVYAAIDGAKALTESGYEGYYEFPCDTDVNVSFLLFSPLVWMCIGADEDSFRLTGDVDFWKDYLFD